MEAAATTKKKKKVHTDLKPKMHNNAVRPTRADRAFQVTVDILLLAAMAGLIISGVMLSRTVFAFFETGQPLVLFFAQYIAMLGMWICAGHYMMKFLRRR